MTRPIVLLTDFGLADPYVGMMKGVILGLCPGACLVDLTHQIAPQNVMQAALFLDMSVRYFSKGSIFVCVVDPGVGTSRKILCARTREHYFLAPDNGLLTLALKQERPLEIRAVSLPAGASGRRVPATFHGRDILAPAAACLARSDAMFSGLGPRVRSYRKLYLPPVGKSRSGVAGQILYFDHFGNAVTNIRRGDLNAVFLRQGGVHLAQQNLGRIQKTYGRDASRPLALINSSGYLEIAVPMGSARMTLGLTAGARVEVRRSGDRPA